MSINPKYYKWIGGAYVLFLVSATLYTVQIVKQDTLTVRPSTEESHDEGKTQSAEVSVYFAETNKLVKYTATNKNSVKELFDELGKYKLLTIETTLYWDRATIDMVDGRKPSNALTYRVIRSGADITDLIESTTLNNYDYLEIKQVLLKP